MERCLWPSCWRLAAGTRWLEIGSCGMVVSWSPDEVLPDPTMFEDVFSNIFEYIDRMFNIARPRRLLYLAVDGVAPRAKMNQQRSRRFRAAKDVRIAEEMEEKLRAEFASEGKAVLPKEESQVRDSNIITPGTEFMHILSMKLGSYIRERMTDDAGWREIQVILSDANVPGEGEHKIMSFIRAQRLSPGYDPNTRHCLYGLDADLIMLALATHELHFSILREDIMVPTEQVCSLRSLEQSVTKAEASTSSLKSRGWFKEHPWQERGNVSHVLKSESPKCLQNEASAAYAAVKKKPYQFLHVWILREYLAVDFKNINCPENVGYDIERFIDDSIFICFFAGNDFLPHMPTLEIHEIRSKKAEYIKMKRVEKFILEVGEYEEKNFTKRSIIREKKLRRICSERADISGDGEIEEEYVKTSSNMASSEAVTNTDQVLSNTKELKQKLKDYLRSQADSFSNTALLTDKVKFGLNGWRSRYYKEKFSAETSADVETIRKALVTSYGEGLCWVLQYYFSGVPSWNWFYPYHYGPWPRI